MKNLKVLLVDDEQDFIETLSERLELRNLYTRLALGGEEALEAVRDDEPDLILLDLKMPGMDGMEVLRQVKKAFSNVKVVMLTGNGSPKAEKRARRLGAYAYLGKPVELECLSEILREAFENMPVGKCESSEPSEVPRNVETPDTARARKSEARQADVVPPHVHSAPAAGQQRSGVRRSRNGCSLRRSLICASSASVPPFWIGSS